jgi:hypothetical protein
LKKGDAALLLPAIGNRSDGVNPVAEIGRNEVTWQSSAYRSPFMTFGMTRCRGGCHASLAVFDFAQGSQFPYLMAVRHILIIAMDPTQQPTIFRHLLKGEGM